MHIINSIHVLFSWVCFFLGIYKEGEEPGVGVGGRNRVLDHSRTFYLTALISIKLVHIDFIIHTHTYKLHMMMKKNHPFKFELQSLLFNLTGLRKLKIKKTAH